MNDPTKLYSVRVYYDVPVLACDRTEAEGIAQTATERGLDFPQVFDARTLGVVGSSQEMPEGWGPFQPLGPYADGRTCAEIERDSRPAS